MDNEMIRKTKKIPDYYQQSYSWNNSDISESWRWSSKSWKKGLYIFYNIKSTRSLYLRLDRSK